MVSLYQVLLSDNRDFFFYPTTQANLTFYSHIVDHETSKILIKNAFDRPLCILQCHRLGYLLDIAYDNCFLIDTQLAYDLAAFLPSLQSFSDLSVRPSLSFVNSSMEIILDNGIKVYRDAAIVK